MKTFKRAAFLLLCAVMLAAVLAGCGKDKPADVELQARGKLDELYKGEFDKDYLKAANRSREDAKAAYQQTVSGMAEKFAYYFHISYLDRHEGMRGRVESLLRNVLFKTDFDLGRAEKQEDDSYIVTVRVRPVKFIELVVEDFDEVYLSDLSYVTADISHLSQEEVEAFYVERDAAWADAVLNLCSRKLEDLGYLDEQELELHLTKDGNGVWTISEADLAKLETLLVSYPDLSEPQDSGQDASGQDEH